MCVKERNERNERQTRTDESDVKEAPQSAACADLLAVAALDVALPFAADIDEAVRTLGPDGSLSRLPVSRNPCLLSKVRESLTWAGRNGVLELFHVQVLRTRTLISELVRTDMYDALFPELHIPKYTSERMIPYPILERRAAAPPFCPAALGPLCCCQPPAEPIPALRPPAAAAAAAVPFGPRPGAVVTPRRAINDAFAPACEAAAAAAAGCRGACAGTPFPPRRSKRLFGDCVEPETSEGPSRATRGLTGCAPGRYASGAPGRPRLTRGVPRAAAVVAALSSIMSMSMEVEAATGAAATATNAWAWAASILSAYILLRGAGAAGTAIAAGCAATTGAGSPVRSSVGVELERVDLGMGGSEGGIGVRVACLTRNGRPSAIAPLR